MSSLQQAAHASALADYSLRTRQAEELAQQLLKGHADASSIVNTIRNHIEEREADRATHFESVINATSMSVTLLRDNLQTLTTDQIKEQLIEIIKSLTIAINH